MVGYMLMPFRRMLGDLGVERIDQINDKMLQLRSAVKRRQKPGHVILLAKNQSGLRNLYKLISLSHLEHFHRFPIMPKSLINENREGLIVGSACAAGELFKAILDHKDWRELRRIASWYDFLEIQPICNNFFLLDKGTIADEEGLRDLNRTIVKLAKELNKPVAPLVTCISWTRSRSSSGISCSTPAAFPTRINLCPSTLRPPTRC